MHFLIAKHSYLGWYMIRVFTAVVLFVRIRQRPTRERYNHAIFRISLGHNVACNYRVNEAESRRWLCFVL